MPLKEVLLKKLDQNCPVVDCADCGRLTTFHWMFWRAYAHLGLRLGGGWRPAREGHRRPLCRECWAEIPREQLPHPTSGRSR